MNVSNEVTLSLFWLDMIDIEKEHIYIYKTYAGRINVVVVIFLLSWTAMVRLE